MAIYCSAECQRAAYKEHKHFCKQTAIDFDRNDHAAYSKVIYSRCVGGAVSLLMHQAQHVKKQRGVIHIKCSHPLVDYCGPRRTGDNEEKRTLTIRFVPEGEEMLNLQEQSLSPGQPKKDVDGGGALEAASQCTEQLSREWGHLASDMKERLATVALEQANVRGLKMCAFFTYLNPGHFTHSHYMEYAQTRNIEQPLSKCIVLDWDWDPLIESNENRQLIPPSSSLSADIGVSASQETSLIYDGVHYDYPIQWLCYNAISPQFYQECSLACQENLQKKIPTPWAGGLRPPLALGIEMKYVPNFNGAGKYFMVFSQASPNNDHS